MARARKSPNSTPKKSSRNNSASTTPEPIVPPTTSTRVSKHGTPEPDTSQDELIRANPPTSPPHAMAPLHNAPLLFIASIGNPGSTYANTLHSAGHTILTSLRTYLDFPPFQKSKPHANGHLSAGSNPPWTLWQSPSLMNESGPGVKAAFNAWLRTNALEGGKLVVVHDELEKPLGSVSLKSAQGLSARGHNGLKSLLAHMGHVPFVRVGVGIGRPVSRDSDDVARFVLRKMSPGEREKVEGAVGEVVKQLMKL